MSDVIDKELADRLASLHKLKTLALKLLDQTNYPAEELIKMKLSVMNKQDQDNRALLQDQLEVITRLNSLKNDVDEQYARLSLRSFILDLNAHLLLM